MAENTPIKLGKLAWRNPQKACNCASLLAYLAGIKGVIAPITTDQVTMTVTHIAGDGKCCQNAADSITKFGFPNMIFQLSMAYAGLRHAGFDIGKADVDGLHVH